MEKKKYFDRVDLQFKEYNNNDYKSLKNLVFMKTKKILDLIFEKLNLIITKRNRNV